MTLRTHEILIAFAAKGILAPLLDAQSALLAEHRTDDNPRTDGAEYLIDGPVSLPPDNEVLVLFPCGGGSRWSTPSVVDDVSRSLISAFLEGPVSWVHLSYQEKATILAQASNASCLPDGSFAVVTTSGIGTELSAHERLGGDIEWRKGLHLGLTGYLNGYETIVTFRPSPETAITAALAILAALGLDPDERQDLCVSWRGGLFAISSGRENSLQ
jgi:hypothetical protein